MAPVEQRRYSISEVSDLVGVPPYLLRQWERRVPKLKPKRDRAGRRYYFDADIDIVKRVKYLLRHEKMTLEGIARRIDQETSGAGMPWTPDEALQLVHQIENRVRDILEQLDSL